MTTPVVCMRCERILTETDQRDPEPRCSRCVQAAERFETVEGLSVCVDCTGMIANGDPGGETDPEAHAEKMSKQWPPAEGWNLVLHCSEHPDGCEGSFSWSSCDGCGSQLGGDRHHAIAMRERSHSGSPDDA